MNDNIVIDLDESVSKIIDKRTIFFNGIFLVESLSLSNLL